MTELALDERRDAAGRLGGAKERGKVRAHDAMEHGVLGGPRPIGVYACGGSAQVAVEGG